MPACPTTPGHSKVPLRRISWGVVRALPPARACVCVLIVCVSFLSHARERCTQTHKAQHNTHRNVGPDCDQDRDEDSQLHRHTDHHAEPHCHRHALRHLVGICHQVTEQDSYCHTHHQQDRSHPSRHASLQRVCPMPENIVLFIVFQQRPQQCTFSKTKYSLEWSDSCFH